MMMLIDGPHEEALIRLKEINAHKTVVSMVRALIADAAKEAGVWPDAALVHRPRRPRHQVESPEPQVETA